MSRAASKADPKRTANRRKGQAPVRRLPELRSLRAPALVLGLGLGAVALGHLGYGWLDRPVEQLVLSGPFDRIAAAEVRARVAPLAAGQGLLSLDLEAVRAAAEAPDWVDRVRVTRRWPSSLVLEVSEQIAAARWSDGGLLNTRGELFDPDDLSGTEALPELGGPAGSQWQVIQRYLALRERLAGGTHEVTRMRVDARGAWSLQLDGRLAVRLGREETSERLQRLLEVALPTVAARIAQVERIDLRYTNGFAVAWRRAAAMGNGNDSQTGTPAGGDAV